METGPEVGDGADGASKHLAGPAYEEARRAAATVTTSELTRRCRQLYRWRTDEGLGTGDQLELRVVEDELIHRRQDLPR